MQHPVGMACRRTAANLPASCRWYSTDSGACSAILCAEAVASRVHGAAQVCMDKLARCAQCLAWRHEDLLPGSATLHGYAHAEGARWMITV